MDMTKRNFLLATAALLAGAAAPAAADDKPAATHDHEGMSALPPEWTGNEEIAMVIYPGFTLLDMAGPQYFLGGLMGAKVHLVAETMDPVTSDTKVSVLPTATFETCPKKIDILFFPGGGDGTLVAMQNKKLMEFTGARAGPETMLTSVCTGSMILAAAGLLKGKRATAHWSVRELLADFGAIPVNERVVVDGNVVTGAGVSAGLDFGLRITEMRRDPVYAAGMQLLAEYDPQPHINSGTPEKADPMIRDMMALMLEPLRLRMKAVAGK